MALVSKKKTTTADTTAQPNNNQVPPMDNSNNQQYQGNQAQPQYANNQQYQEPQANTVTGNVGGLSGLSAFQALFSNAIPLNVGSNILNGYLEMFRETYAEQKKAGATLIDAEFISLPQETLELPYSGIAVCYVHHQGVTVHTLMLEDDGPLPEARSFQLSPHETVEVPTTPADTYNQTYYDTVMQQVQRKFGEVAVFDGGMQVVYRTINMDDPNQVNRILTAATNAAVGSTSLKTVGGDISEGRTLAHTLRSNGIQLNANVNTNPEPLTTPNGLPVRRDIVVKSTATLPGATQNNLRATRSGGARFAETSAFATLEYVAPEVPQYNPYMAPQPVPTQRYIPRIVITNIDSDGIQTLPSVLLGISTTTVIQEGLLWTEPFRPQKGRRNSDYDIRDIGAIGYDIKELNADEKPGMVDTKSNSFTNADFYRLMASTVMPTPIYSIDIEEAGSLSWLTKVFSLAANNDADAKRAIIEACDSLTDNLFSTHFKGDTILQADNNRIFLGTYRPLGDSTGELRDIRDLDYLAILNICGEDPRIVEDFEMTQRASSGPLVRRLSELNGILEQIMGPSLTIKGYANRFTFHHLFIEALAKSTRDAKVAPMFSNLPTQVQNNARQRMNDFQFAMVEQQNIGQVYQGGGMGGYQQAGQPLQPFQAQWGGPVQYRQG